jgi:hypothetical protein
MNTERWHRNTTLMALATSLDHMLAIDYRLQAKSRFDRNALQKIRSQITTGAIERKGTVAASLKASRHRSA